MKDKLAILAGISFLIFCTIGFGDALALSCTTYHYDYNDSYQTSCY